MASTAQIYECGMCNDIFTKKILLQQHLVTHRNATVLWACPTCDKYFTTRKITVEHIQKTRKCRGEPRQVSEHTKHTKAAKQPQRTAHGPQLDGTRERVPPVNNAFTNGGRNNSPSVVAQATMRYVCDSCHQTFHTLLAYNAHIGSSCKGSSENKANKGAGVHASENASPMSGQAMSAFYPSQNMDLRPACGQCGLKYDTVYALKQHLRQDHSLVPCDIESCVYASRTEPGLKVHKIDVHGIGGKPIDLNQRGMRRQNLPTVPQQSVLHMRPLPSSPTQTRAQKRKAPSAAVSGEQSRLSSGLQSPLHTAYPTVAPQGLPPPPGLDDEQAGAVSKAMMHLKLAVQPSIDPSGYVSYLGNQWSRVPVFKQEDVVKMLAKECHLPRALQSFEHFPRLFEKQLSREMEDLDEFSTSPNPEAGQNKLRAVVISCHKVLIEGGLEEIIFLSVIDFLTSNVLLSNLVGTYECAKVQDWRTDLTALSSYDDMIALVKSGYAVLKGWRAARDALWTLIDADTILVGHNLRDDLDSLRMVHGRGVDIAIMVQKAAEGPMGRRQLSLDSLIRELLSNVKLQSYPPGKGRDCLENAFAVRQLVLEILKKEEKIRAWAKQRSIEYQRTIPSLSQSLGRMTLGDGDGCA